MPEVNIGVASVMLDLLLTDQLKEQTKTHHQSLEKQIIPLIKAIQSPNDYAGLLMLFYTYFGGLELLVDASLNKSAVPDYPQRRKTASLVDDLSALNTPLQGLASCNDLPQIKNHLQSIGAMYVMEGSTLGGLHIAKMIAEKLMNANPDAFNFFNGYKNETQQMWQTFKTIIDEMRLDERETATVVDAANETFIRFSNWIRQQETTEKK